MTSDPTGNGSLAIEAPLAGKGQSYFGASIRFWYVLWVKELRPGVGS
jgi:hypothetical protein